MSGIDAIIEAGTKSVLLSKLQETAVQDLSYSVQPSYPILGKRHTAINSENTITGSVHGQEVMFKVPRSLLLRFMQIETTLTTGTTGPASTIALGLDLFEWIEVRSNSKVLYRQSDAYTRSRTFDQCSDKSIAIARRAMPLDPTTELPEVVNAGDVKTYTPIYTGWSEQVENNLDLNFHEQITVVARFNSLARMGLPDALGGDATCRLIVWTWRPIDKYYSMLRAKNLKPNSMFSMLFPQTYTERQACTSTTSNTFRMNINYPVFKTYFFIRDNTGTGNGPFRRINDYTLRIGGLALVESSSNLVSKFEQEYTGGSQLTCTSATTVSRIDDYIICINWGLDPQNRTYNSGACSFAEINTPTLVLNHETLGTASQNDIVVVSEYWSILSSDPNNGSLEISVQS